MNFRYITLLLLISIIFYHVLLCQSKTSLSKSNSNSNSNYIAINNCKMWVSNNGSGSHDPFTDSKGFLWPDGEEATTGLVFQDGLIWAGMVDSQIVFNGNTHRGHLRPGKILSYDSPDDSSLNKYRVFKIRKDWADLPNSKLREAYERDYNEWPVIDGAPSINLGGEGNSVGSKDISVIIGDEILWYVSNDMDPNVYYPGARSLGLEFQTTIFASYKQDELLDVVFKKYKIINKGNFNIKDMYFGYWSDPDVGDGGDDYCGCDSILNLGYAYNCKSNDAVFDTKPPAIGYEILSTSPKLPKNKLLTSFNIFANTGNFRDPVTSDEYYNVLKGKDTYGRNIRNPSTGRISKYTASGDPVLQTGWYEGNGWRNGPYTGDRRMLLSTGPFNFSPNDTIEIVFAIIVGSGADNLASIQNLKKTASDVKKIFAKDLSLSQYTHNLPALHYYPKERAVKLWWERDAENISYQDPYFIPGVDTSPNYYMFEGYRLWQYKDIKGTDPHLLTVFDIPNNIDLVYDNILINGANVWAPVITGTNNGLKREINISTDYFNNYTPLNDYSPYYFGITAYYYNKDISPMYLETPHKPLEVIPGNKQLDAVYPYEEKDVVIAKQVTGNSDAIIRFHIIDPTAFNGDTYEVKFEENNNQLTYSLYNKSKNTLLLQRSDDFSKDLTNKPIFDGFKISVENKGKDSIKAENTKYRVKSVLEVKGKNGEVLTQPIDVVHNLNSTNKWQVKIKGTYKRLNWQETPKDEGLGFEDYELRFTGNSKYFVSGRAYSFNPILKDDPLAKNELPFEAWCTGRYPDSTNDDYRLTLKILDFDRKDSSRAVPDSAWTQFENNDWEEIFAFKPSFDPAIPPLTSGISKFTDHKFGCLSISGEIPEPGTVIRILSYKPIKDGDVFEAKLDAGNLNDLDAAKKDLEKISVFPNPYFGSNELGNAEQNFIRFISLPREITIRIFNLAGVFIRKLEKNDVTPYVDWDLKNDQNVRVGSGMYLAYLDMPGIGKKILKIAIVQEKKYLERN